jgi:hypothetical protein
MKLALAFLASLAVTSAAYAEGDQQFDAICETSSLHPNIERFSIDLSRRTFCIRKVEADESSSRPQKGPCRESEMMTTIEDDWITFWEDEAMQRVFWLDRNLGIIETAVGSDIVSKRECRRAVFSPMRVF